MEKLELTTREAWRAWLSENHGIKKEIWLVYNKKGSGKPSIAYNASVEEALCFGWIDSIIKKLDQNQYVRKFTPRKEVSNWSASNIKRVEKMIRAGLMTEYGLRLVEAAKASGKWDEPGRKPTLEYHIHPDFEEALRQNPSARDFFEKLAPTYQKQFIGWIQVARQDATRRKRIEESIQLLTKGEKLGLR